MTDWKLKIEHYFLRYENLLKIFSANFLMRGSVVAINLGTGILMRRELGEADSGLFGLFIGSLVLFATMLNFGFNGSAIYFAGKKPDKLELYLTTNFIVTAVSIFVIALSLFVFSFFFQFQSNWLRIIFIICYAIYSFSLVYRSFLLGMGENLYMQKIDLLTRIAYALFMVFSYYFHCLSVLNIAIFMTLEYLVFTYLAHGKTELKIWPLSWDTKFFKENILFNSKSYIAGILYILLLKADQFIIKIFFNNHQVGVYGIGGTIVENLFMISTIICVMYLPKLLETDDFTIIINKSKKILGLIFISSLGMAFVLYFLSPWLYLWYYKKPNIEGVSCLRVLLIGFVTFSLFLLNYTIYFSVRLKKSLLIILGFGVGLNLILNFIYLPKYGIIASAWASTIAYSLVSLLSILDLYYLKKRNYIKKTLVLDEERQ